ncbi:MAG: cobalamin biosynthesis protein, partial [Inquilinus sp.]|nr:cobalamin biosynthesis protein [Inquilinus sp.]
AAAALVLPRATGAGALTAMRRDAPRHRSPNAGWPEAAVAGALGFALAGPRHYGEQRVDDGWMGDGRADLDAADIRAALWLCRAAWLVLMLAVAALALV